MAKIPITFLITDLHLGGTPRLLRDLAIGLQDSTNYQPTIISLKPFPQIGNRQSEIGNPTIPEQLHQQNILTISLDISSPLHFPAAIPHLDKLLNHAKPKLLYSLLLHANLLATLTLPFLNPKPKLIHSLHTLQPDPAWHWTLTGLLAPHADAVIAPSKPILDKIAQHGPFQRGQVIANGIDINRFATAESFAPDELPWPPSAPVVGYIGRYDPVKNLPLLLRAFAQLLTSHALESPLLRPGGRPPHLALVGYGPEEPALRALAADLHIASQVHFIAPTTVPERWYKCFTCHCLPSSVEGFGLTLVEAIAAGIPVAAIDTPVARSIVRQNIDGILIPRPEGNLLAHALHALIAQTMPAPHIPPSTPICPPKPSSATLDYLQNHFSTAKMVELHADFFKIFLP